MCILHFDVQLVRYSYRKVCSATLNMSYTVSQSEVLRRLHSGLSPFYTAKIVQLKVQIMNCSKPVEEATIHATFSMHGQITMFHNTDWLSTSIFRGLYLDRSIWQNIASLAGHHLCCTTCKSDNNCFDLPNRTQRGKAVKKFAFQVESLKFNKPECGEQKVL